MQRFRLIQQTIVQNCTLLKRCQWMNQIESESIVQAPHLKGILHLFVCIFSYRSGSGIVNMTLVFKNQTVVPNATVERQGLTDSLSQGNTFSPLIQPPLLQVSKAIIADVVGIVITFKIDTWHVNIGYIL